MRRLILSFLFCYLISFPVFAQKAQKIDEFGRISCGNFTSRVDQLFAMFQNSPDSKLYILYYGGRYRKIRELNEKTNNYDIIKLEYPHRNDGFTYAKSIPVYLTDVNFRPSEVQKLFKDRIILINGGYRENTELELWFVPTGAQIPEPSPTFTEKDIKFMADQPLRTPNFNCCYDNCQTKRD